MTSTAEDSNMEFVKLSKKVIFLFNLYQHLLITYSIKNLVYFY